MRVPIVLRGGGIDLDGAWRGIDADLAPRSRAMIKRLGIGVSFRVERLPSANVVGQIPDETDETIVVGAHYDHFDPIEEVVFPDIVQLNGEGWRVAVTGCFKRPEHNDSPRFSGWRLKL